jgi:hypothetical protein
MAGVEPQHLAQEVAGTRAVEMKLERLALVWLGPYEYLPNLVPRPALNISEF